LSTNFKTVLSVSFVRELISGQLGVNLHIQHWTRRHKTTPRLEAIEPRFGLKPFTRIDIDATVAQRNRVNTRSGTGGRLQTETTIKQRVVILESKVEPP
jgi:hypothetical protein